MRFLVLLLCACVGLLSAHSPGSLQHAHAEPSPTTAPAPSASPASESAPLAPSALPAAATPAQADPDQTAGTPTAPELNDLFARIQALERIDPLDDSVRRPLDVARAALERSRASRALGEGEAEARTRQLARAAVELAEARLRLLRERALLYATQARHAAALTEQAAAKQALDRERARVLELSREEALP